MDPLSANTEHICLPFSNFDWFFNSRSVGILIIDSASDKVGSDFLRIREGMNDSLTQK